MLIYYCIAILINIIATIVFHKSINITELSVLPLFLIALMFFQAITFKNEKWESFRFQTRFDSKLTYNEENDMSDSVSKFLLATIPFMIPFVIFFPSFAKTFSILIYFLGLACGGFVYKFKNKDKIYYRLVSEEQERIEQEKKEQLGKWK